jgi:kynureninase
LGRIESRGAAEQLDREDELARFRTEFELPPGIVYLDGNSLGALPRRVRERVRRTLEHEWGEGLIGSWNAAGWISGPQRAGDKVARLIGAGTGEVVVTDSTSVNLFKVLSVALAANPARRVIISERANFPTDLYVIDGVVKQLGGRHELALIDSTEEALEEAIERRGGEVAAVVLTHIHYTTARIWDMARVTAAAHAAGAMMVWDLSHSAGIFPVEVGACDVDFAVGCGYKHLNAGPGAPAFIYVPRRLQERFTQPISGWMGDARPFEFRSDYAPARGIDRYLSGTPAVLGTAAVDASVELILEAPMAAIRAKSIALGELFVDLAGRHCEGLEAASPREGARRGSHVSFRHPDSYPVMQALIEAGVVGDCRPPDLLRFGFAPLYIRYVDVWDAVMKLAEVLGTRAWDQAPLRARKVVT